MVDPKALIPIRDELTAWLAKFNALIGGVTPPDDATIIYPGKGQKLTDANGHVWTFGTNGFQDGGPQIWGFNVLRDGVDVYGGMPQRPVSRVAMALIGGVVWLQDLTNLWQKDTGSSWVSGPSPIPALADSPDDTVIQAADYPDFSKFLVIGGHIWRFGPSGWILKDGFQYASGTANSLTTKNHVAWAKSGATWWKDNGSNWAQQSAGPV